MICPKCSTPITKAGRFCAGCGQDFGEAFGARVRFYFELKEEVEGFGAVQESLASGLAGLTKKLLAYEELLSGDLEKSAPGSPAPASAEKTPSTGAAAPSSPIGREETRTPVRISPSSSPEPRRDSSAFEVQVGQKWLLAAGVLTMIFGVGYFLKYSFEQGWVGPAGRVAMAYVWGILFLVAGDRFRRKIERFGLSLIGGGIAVLYFSTFAAFQIYHLFDQLPSFAVMVFITLLACVLALTYDSKWLAVLGLAGGFLTPALLSTGQDNQLALMTYMTILNLGLLGVAFHKKWDLLNFLGFAFTYVLYAAWYGQHYGSTKFWPAVLFLNLFFLIYALVPFFSRLRSEEPVAGRDIALLGVNAVLGFGFSYVMITERFGLAWVSIVSLAYAAVFLSQATHLYRSGRQSLDLFTVLLAKAMLFLLITVPVLFSGHWITIFWSAQGFAILWMGIRLERRSLVAGGFLVLLLSVLKFLFHDYPDVFQASLINGFIITRGYLHLLAERCAATTTLLAVLYAAAVHMKKARPAISLFRGQDVAVCFFTFGAVLFIALTTEVSSFFFTYLPPARFAALSVLWTLFSVVLMITGFRRNSPRARKISFGLFLATALKVFLFDMANVSTPYRIISFIILGLVLTGTSFLYYKHKDRLLSAFAEDGTGDDGQARGPGAPPAGKAAP